MIEKPKVTTKEHIDNIVKVADDAAREKAYGKETRSLNKNPEAEIDPVVERSSLFTEEEVSGVVAGLESLNASLEVEQLSKLNKLNKLIEQISALEELYYESLSEEGDHNDYSLIKTIINLKSELVVKLTDAITKLENQKSRSQDSGDDSKLTNLRQLLEETKEDVRNEGSLGQIIANRRSIS